MTSLAQQLKRLAVPQAQASTVTHDKHRKSLLFDAKEAASLDRETFYALGVNGLQELELIDPSFQEFESTLFDEASKALERSVQTPEVDAWLNRQIGNFLHRLSPYFLLRPAQKCLEWLIHRFFVHQYNVDEVLGCVLPYHDTKIFVRVVQLLSLQDDTNKWHWLQPIQTPGVPLSRTTLISQCYKDPVFLRFVCDLVPSAIKAHRRAFTHSQDSGGPSDAEAPSRATDAVLRVVTCFYCSCAVGAIEVARPVGEKLLSGILPYILKGLKSKFVDYQASSYMITCQLALKVKMKADLVYPIIQSICKHLSSALAVEGLSCVAILCHTQPVQSLPESAFEKLCSFSGTVSALQSLSRAPNAAPLLRLFLARLVHAAVGSLTDGDQGEEEQPIYWPLLEEILQQVQLDGILTKETAKLLMEEYTEARKQFGKRASLVSNLKERALPVISALERRYPEAMDQALGSFLTPDVGHKEQKLIQEFISMSVSAPKYKVLSETSTSLVLSLNHASPDVRLLAVKHLAERIAAGETLESFCAQSLLQRLRDDKLQVVNAALAIGKPLCKIVPQDELLDLLKDILLKAKMKTRKGLTSVKLALRLVTDGRLWHLGNDARLQLVSILLPYLFYCGGHRETPGSEKEEEEAGSEEDDSIETIIRTSRLNSDHPIFKGISWAYAAGDDHPPANRQSAIMHAMVLTIGRNLAHMTGPSRKSMIDVLESHACQPHVHRAFQRALLAVVLLNAGQRTAYADGKVALATSLLRHLQTTVDTMLAPGFAVTEPEQPLPALSSCQDGLPLALPAHLASLLGQGRRRRRLRRADEAPRMQRAEVEAALWCLDTVVADVQMPPSMTTDTTLWAANRPNTDPVKHYLTWLLRLLDLLTLAASAKKKRLPNVGEFKAIMSKVIQHHLNTPDRLWSYLSLIWGISCQSAGDRLYPVSVFYLARCLHIAVTSSRDKSMTAEVAARLLGQKSEVFPSLLLVLSCDVEPIREAAVRCLQALVSSLDDGESGQTPYTLLAKFLASKGDEMTADAEYLKQAFRLYFIDIVSVKAVETVQATPGTGKKKRKKRTEAELKEKTDQTVEGLRDKIEALNWLAVFLYQEPTPRFIRRALLSLLSEVKNEHLLSLLLDLFHKLLGRCREGLALSPDEGTVLESIARRLQPETAGVVRHCLDDLSHALALERPVMPGGKSPQRMVLKQMTPAFFAALPTREIQQSLLAVLIDGQVATQDSSVATSIRRTLRKLPLDAEQIVTELDRLQGDGKATSLRQAKQARRSKASVGVGGDSDGGSPAAAEALRWQRVTHILELLQQKKLRKIEGVATLLPALFSLLARSLEVVPTDEAGRSSAEYLKQLVLTLALAVCRHLSPDDRPLPADRLAQDQFNVELVVKCVRTSEDAQTHRQGLLLLATAAGLFPEHVLHNIMAIFTFMGSNMLHRDDSYSFQIILRTVDTVIPALMKVGAGQSLPPDLSVGGVDGIVLMVMRVFADAFPHVPEHRRLPLFARLVQTVGAGQHLSRMLALLIGGYVAKGSAAMHPGDDVDVKGAGRSIGFWLDLCQEFPPDVQISSLTKLLEYVATLTEDKETDQRVPSVATRRGGTRQPRPEATPSGQEVVFDADPHVRARQMRQFRFTALCFLPYVVSSGSFIQKVTDMSQEDSESLKKLLQRLLEVLLGYIAQVAQSVQRNAGKDITKYWKALLHRSYEALDKVIALLPSWIFIDVIASLLGNSLATIRRKAMEILNNKLLQHQEYFDKDQSTGLLGLIDSLLAIATATGGEVGPGAAGQEEKDTNRHTALYSLKLLCALLGEGSVAAFGPVLEAAVTICEEQRVNLQVQGSAMLCLAECVRSLKAHSIRYLPRLMPRLLEVLASKATTSGSSDLHLLSAVTAVQRVAETLPHFQSPYLVAVLLQVCRLSANGEEDKSQLNLRLSAVAHQLASKVAARLLLPAFGQAYDAMADSEPGSIGPLMSTLSDHLGALDKTDMAGYQPQLVSFFLVALDYRAKHAEGSLEEVGKVEGHVIGAMLTLVMKLSEASFRPLLLKVVDWATRGTASKDRLLTLYRLADAVAGQLKSLFTLFAGPLVAKAADILGSNNSAKTKEQFLGETPHADEKASLLLDYILDCLHKCCLYDKGGFVTKERFQHLMQPLVDQIENLQGSESAYQDRVSGHLTPCIGQLLAASRDSSTWQPLNYQVLLKTRHASPKVRFAALTVLQELHQKLSEDYLSLLPETIPFLAELMEDESVEVEQQCQLVVNELEKTLGEPLQKYF